MFNFAFWSSSSLQLTAKWKKIYEFPLNKMQCCFRVCAASAAIMKGVCCASIKIITPWFPYFCSDTESRGLEMDSFCPYTLVLNRFTLEYWHFCVCKIVVWHFKPTFPPNRETRVQDLLKIPRSFKYLCYCLGRNKVSNFQTWLQSEFLLQKVGWVKY